MKKVFKALKVVCNIVLWIFVAFAVFITVLVLSAQNNKEGLSNIGGKSLITIASDSMKPTFKKGDLIIDKVLTTEEKSKCAVGDVITFYADLNGDGNNEVNTHRIIETYEESGYTYYVTKGDNTETNKVNDAPVSYTKVLGKYTGTKLAYAGSIISFLQTSVGFMCVIVLPLIVFFLFELYNFITVVIRLKSKCKVSAEVEEEIKKRAVEEYLRSKGSGAAEEASEDMKSEEQLYK